MARRFRFAKNSFVPTNGLAAQPQWAIYGHILLTLVIGLAGALVFRYLHVPLPWLLGPIVFCLTAAVAGMPVRLSGKVRPVMTTVIGTMLGSTFTWELLAHVTQWYPTVLVLWLNLAVAGAVCVAYFRAVVGLDTKTAFFSGMPAGVTEMTALSDEHDADTAVVALIQSTRILLVVCALPFIIRMVSDMQLVTRPMTSVSIFDAPLASVAWLTVVCTSGAVIGHLLRFPAKMMFGPLLLSAVIHMTGISDFKPPVELVNGAQMLIGCSVATRFSGVNPLVILRLMALSVVSTCLLLIITVIFALIASKLSYQQEIPVLLAFSPGGLAEMSLVALALNLEVAFVTTHHILRVIAVVLGANLLLRYVLKSKPRSTVLHHSADSANLLDRQAEATASRPTDASASDK
ncbi:MAG: AbrB family transcriptional regulator [Rhizobiaceae bacterium]